MVISIASQKGGTGKTSTSISLAAGLARKGKKVLLIDIDSQANSSKVLLPHYPEIPKEETIYSTVLERQGLVVHPTQVPNLSIVPSHILLSNTDIELTTAKDHREARLKAKLDRIKGDYDYVFIDNPPALGWLTLNAFTASDQALVVVAPGYFELDSLVQLSKTLEEVREFFNPDLRLLGYLFTMSEPTINTSVSLQILRQAYTGQVLKTVIPRNTDLRDAHFQKQDIFAFNPRAKAALAYDKLIREVFLREPEALGGRRFQAMKKQLNVNRIQSELRGGSAFFPGYQGGPPLPRQRRLRILRSLSDLWNKRTTVRPGGRSPARPFGILSGGSLPAIRSRSTRTRWRPCASGRFRRRWPVRSAA